MSKDKPPRRDDLAEQIEQTALAFRGYNLTNLGRSAELLRHPRFGRTVKQHLDDAGEICSDILGKRVDLVRRAREGRETSLRSYAEAIALIVGMEVAQIELLKQFFDINVEAARLAVGYSLGELSAVTCFGSFAMADVLKIPLAMANDCAELAKDVTMGVLFSRGPALPEDDVNRLCLRINTEGKGVIGISSILSPNTVLLLGQRKTVDRFKHRMHELLHPKIHLRVNKHHWPPMHTPIVWQRSIPNRAAVMMQQIPGGFESPRPPVLSLADGEAYYNDVNPRELMHRWVDHPQRLWDGVYEILSAGVKTVVHVGPEPNLFPATFKRLSENINQQTSGKSLGSLGLRAVSGIVRRPWLANLLPSRTSLLRAPKIRHIVLEDWLLSQDES